MKYQKLLSVSEVTIVTFFGTLLGLARTIISGLLLVWHIAFHIFVVTSMNTTAEPNLPVCAAGCIAGILVATAGMSTAIEYCSIYTEDAI